MDKISKFISLAEKYFLKEEYQYNSTEDEKVFLEEIEKIRRFLNERQKLSNYLTLLNLKSQVNFLIKNLYKNDYRNNI
ncbi:MAG: hypothetical protein QXW35_01695 [Candidatus Aenigmatarchaeota archaeon]